jgi:hypothetical protein
MMPYSTAVAPRSLLMFARATSHEALVRTIPRIPTLDYTSLCGLRPTFIDDGRSSEVSFLPPTGTRNFSPGPIGVAVVGVKRPKRNRIGTARMVTTESVRSYRALCVNEVRAGVPRA